VFKGPTAFIAGGPFLILSSCWGLEKSGHSSFAGAIVHAFKAAFFPTEIKRRLPIQE
jgi:hypothetical protein